VDHMEVSCSSGGEANKTWVSAAQPPSPELSMKTGKLENAPWEVRSERATTWFLNVTNWAPAEFEYLARIFSESLFKALGLSQERCASARFSWTR